MTKDKNHMREIYRQIVKPTLLLDREVATRNIRRMADKVSLSGVRFRPHFKTHQSAEIGEWFRQAGVEAITVSSVDMAHYFADHHWDDILIAIPTNLRQGSDLNDLARRISLSILIESVDVAHRLGGIIKYPVDVWLKIDIGYHRTGIDWQDTAEILQVSQAIESQPMLSLRGVLTHAGHTYAATSAADVQRIYFQGVKRLKAVQEFLISAGLQVEISVGDTPGCSLVPTFGPIDEVRPGNFVFYDVMQYQLSACTIDDLAVAVACPVIAKHHDRKHLVLYGGAIHLSKESLPGPGGGQNFGYVSKALMAGWSEVDFDSMVISLSQEHGLVRASDKLFQETKIGDIVLILPIHSCLTANLLGSYLTLDGFTISMNR